MPPGNSSARPARDNSIKAASTAGAGACAARTISSRDTGVGESRSAMVSRSFSAAASEISAETA